jgi:hypothetical protein
MPDYLGNSLEVVFVLQEKKLIMAQPAFSKKVRAGAGLKILLKIYLESNINLKTT